MSSIWGSTSTSTSSDGDGDGDSDGGGGGEASTVSAATSYFWIENIPIEFLAIERFCRCIRWVSLFTLLDIVVK